MTSVSQESIIPYIPMLLNTSNIEVMIRMGMTLSFGMQLHNAATYIIDRWEKTIMYHIMKVSSIQVKYVIHSNNPL
ncbi:hypothetical protein BDB01DRAFT_803845 [Pilobolus umbonatus]|nr:hypothetical protein BDB01DRAFT_803845 [Pilobolus umbonatus]